MGVMEQCLNRLWSSPVFVRYYIKFGATMPVNSDLKSFILFIAHNSRNVVIDTDQTRQRLIKNVLDSNSTGDGYIV